MTTDSRVTDLDTIVITLTLLMVGGVVAGLMFVTIPDKNLPVLSSLATGLLALPACYGAFRWGSSVTAKKLAGTQEPGE